MFKIKSTQSQLHDCHYLLYKRCRTSLEWIWSVIEGFIYLTAGHIIKGSQYSHSNNWGRALNYLEIYNLHNTTLLVFIKWPVSDRMRKIKPHIQQNYDTFALHLYMLSFLRTAQQIVLFTSCFTPVHQWEPVRFANHTIATPFSSRFNITAIYNAFHKGQRQLLA